MAELKIAPYITLEQGDTGDVYANVFTPIGQFIATLPFANMFMLNQKDIVGSKIYGLGNQYVGSQGGGIHSVNKLYFYFYNTTTTATLNNEGKIPSFMNAFLDIDESKLVAYACDVTVIDSGKTKQGITKEREGLINTTAPVVGCTMYWPQGYGTGEINAMAVSLVDLSTLKTLNSADAQKSAVFGGTQFGTTANYEAYRENYGLIKPNVVGLTTAEEIIVKIDSKKFKHNFVTGSTIPYTDNYTENHDFPFYGCNSVVVGDKLYFASAYGSSQYRITEIDLTTKTVRYGYGGYSVDLYSSAIKIGSDVYFQTAKNTTAITLKKLDIASLSIIEDIITVNLPAYFSTNSRNFNSLTQFDSGDFGLVDGTSGVCYRFTNLSDVEGSIVDTYFTGAMYGYPVTPIKSGVNTLFACISGAGFYQDVTLANKNPGLLKFILADGEYGPLIAYNKFETSYNKSASAELTSSFMITASAL